MLITKRSNLDVSHVKSISISPFIVSIFVVLENKKN